jgi:hypothetical protein
MTTDSIVSEAELKHSRWGIVSFALSMLAGISICGLFGLSGILQVSIPGGVSETSVLAVVLGLVIMSSVFINLIGLAFGIVGLFGKNRKRVFPTLGTIFNLVILLLTCVMMSLGFYIKYLRYK